MHQSRRTVCIKFQSSSSYRTSKGPTWSNWYTLIYLKNCIKQGFSGLGRTYSEFGVFSGAKSVDYSLKNVCSKIQSCSLRITPNSPLWSICCMWSNMIMVHMAHGPFVLWSICHIVQLILVHLSRGPFVWIPSNPGPPSCNTTTLALSQTLHMTECNVSCTIDD